MTDDDLMTFGKYNGVPICKVPAGYLLWLWENGMYRDNTLSQRNDPVRLYIVENFHALETECPDTIINHRPEKTSFTAAEYTPQEKRRKAVGREVKLGHCDNCGSDRVLPDDICLQCGVGPQIKL